MMMKFVTVPTEPKPTYHLTHQRIAIPKDVDYGNYHPFDIIQKKNKYQERNLQWTDDQLKEYRPIQFGFNTADLDRASTLDPSKASHVEFIKTQVLPQAANVWSNALSVYPSNNIAVTSNGCFDLSGIDGEITFDSIDFVMFVYLDEKECFQVDSEVTIVAFAKFCQTDQFDRPTVGKMTLCTPRIDIHDDKSRSRTIATAIREMGHMLGFTSSHMAYYYNAETGEPRTPNKVSRKVECVDGSMRNVILPHKNTMVEGMNIRGSRYFEVVTPTVVNVIRNHFGCAYMTGARLENLPTNDNDCFGSHWDQRHYNLDIMTAVQRTYEQVLSPLTLAFMEDMGWYKANYSQAQASSFGHGAGCDFLYEDCIVNGEVPSYGETTFCTPSSPIGCTVDHKKVAACDHGLYDGPIPIEYRYFEDPLSGGSLPQLDYCPTYANTLFHYDPEGIFELDCANNTLEGTFLANDAERFGSDSRCFQTGFNRAYCFRSRCNEENYVVEIQVGTFAFICSNDGETLSAPFLNNFQLTCPRMAQICPELVCPKNCAGRGICDRGKTRPKCICHDPSDPSPFCANSPIEKIMPPTVSPAPSISYQPSSQPTILESSSSSLFMEQSSWSMIVMVMMMLSWMLC